jgi:hypothetical protein
MMGYVNVDFRKKQMSMCVILGAILHVWFGRESLFYGYVQVL